MSLLLETSLESVRHVEGGLICPQRQNVFIHNPIQQISYNGEKKDFVDIGSSIMALDSNCAENLVVYSSTWHKVVDIETGRKVREIYEQDGFVSAVCWSPTNPNVFASTGTDSSIRIWDIRQHPAQILQLRRQRRYKSITYSPDSNFLAFVGDSINLVDLSNPRNISQINCPSPILTVRFNPVEYLLATSSEDRVVRFWDIDTSECVSQSLSFESTVKNIEFDGQGRCLIASCGPIISAFHWEPFEFVGQLDLSSIHKGRNLSGSSGTVPNSDGSSTNRHNSMFKSLAIKNKDDDILQLSFDEATQKLLLHSTTLTELCSQPPIVRPLDFNSNGISSFGLNTSPNSIESPSSAFIQDTHSPFAQTPLGFSFENDSQDSAIGTIRSFEASRERHQSSSESQSSKTMAAVCCLMAPLTPNRLSPALNDSQTHLPRPQNLTASHSESRILKPTRARSNVRLNAKETRGSTSTLNQRTPSVEAVNIKSNDDHHNKTPTRSKPIVNRQPTTPIDERLSQSLSLRRNGSLPNTESSVAEKHASVMEMLNSRLRDCRRINSLLRTKNGEDESLEEAANLNDGLHMFAQILRSYKQQPSAYSLQFCARATPTLKALLSHKNSNYVDLALDTLANILNEFTEPIKHALSPNALSMGVDIAAEQRHMYCSTCKQALTELYLNSSFILGKLSTPQRDYFNMLMPMIEQIAAL